MSRYLAVNLEVKIKGEWKFVKFGNSDTWYCQGALRDYISKEWEYDSLPTDLTSELREIFDSFDYKPRFYIRSYKELEAIEIMLRERWLKQYKDACSRNFYIKALNKAFNKRIKVDDDEYVPDIQYLEEEKIYTWTLFSNFTYFIYNVVDMNFDYWNTEDVRLIFHIE